MHVSSSERDLAYSLRITRKLRAGGPCLHGLFAQRCTGHEPAVFVAADHGARGTEVAADPLEIRQLGDIDLLFAEDDFVCALRRSEHPIQ